MIPRDLSDRGGLMAKATEEENPTKNPGRVWAGQAICPRANSDRVVPSTNIRWSMAALFECSKYTLEGSRSKAAPRQKAPR